MNSSFKGIASSLACGCAATSQRSLKNPFHCSTVPVITNSVLREFGSIERAC